MRTLQIAVRKKWFDLIKSGEKTEEYRETTEYWKKRLEGKDYDKLVITLGYPKKTDLSRRMEFPYRGYYERSIISEEFGGEPVPVFAIRLIA